MEEEYLLNPLITCMAIFFQNNAKCTYFHTKMYLRGRKMYLVNNVLENQIRAVPPLKIIFDTCHFSRKLIACSKLNLPPPPPFVLSFNPMQYSTIGTSNLKEASYSSAELGRGSYLSSILDTLTGADIRVLVKFLEEASQATDIQP